ncbi:MAG: thiamine pyrophosphate-binding protein [Actinomycetota bacterium]|nr:thiamine pyrophosphate-binding protein [Actinomycetota bacterium]
MATGGEVLVAALRELGVEVAFGLPGVHNLAAWKAFPGSGIRLVGVRHEQTAGYAADGYARATGRLGVALTTTGPGAANVVTATGEAWACHSPVLVIATDIPSTVRQPGRFRGVLHETTDQASFFRPVTKGCLRVGALERLYDDVVAAGRLAMRMPRRPVYVEVPTDFLSMTSTMPVAGAPPGHPPPDPGWPDDAGLAAAIDLIAQARRPLIWAGGGASAAGASDHVAQLATWCGAPVLTSYGGRGILAPDHPALVPLPPQVPEAGQLWDAADLVVVLGSDLDAMNTQGFRQPAPPAVVTVDLAEPVNLLPDVWLAGDVRDVLEALLAGLYAAPRRQPWFTRPAGRELYAGPETAFLDAFEAGLPEDAVVLADMCIAGYWYGGFGRVRHARGLAYPVGWGTLGFGFPAGLGASLSGRPAVSLVGDGGFLFACGDLATAAQERLPLTVVLVDDGGYGMLSYDFRKDGEEPVGCDLEPPDFVALARSFRVDAEQVTVGGLSRALAAAVASSQPRMLVVKAAFTPPPNTSPRWYRAAG